MFQSAAGKATPERVRARVTAVPPIQCFPDGHLVAVSLYCGHYKSGKTTAREARIPFPYIREGAVAVSINLQFDVSRPLHADSAPQPLAIKLKNSADPNKPKAMTFSVRLKIASEDDRVWCSSNARITLGSLSRKKDLGGVFGGYTTKVKCRKPLAAGRYTLRLTQAGVEEPREYQMTFYVVSADDRPSEYYRTDEIWRLENVARLPLPDFYSEPDEEVSLFRPPVTASQAAASSTQTHSTVASTQAASSEVVIEASPAAETAPQLQRTRPTGSEWWIARVGRKPAYTERGLPPAKETSRPHSQITAALCSSLLLRKPELVAVLLVMLLLGAWLCAPNHMWRRYRTYSALKVILLTSLVLGLQLRVALTLWCRDSDHSATPGENL